jgi:hypothetical protein
MQRRIGSLLVVASMAAPAAAQVGGSNVKLEILGGPLWKVETGEHGVERRGPGAQVGATFRLGRRLAFGTDLAWIHLTDPYPDYDETSTGVHLTASVLWHLGQGNVQGYVGLGGLAMHRNRCSRLASSADPPWCFTETSVWPVLQLGAKVISARNGLVVGPDIRLEGFSLRVGLNVGWASIKRKS